jgi:hypothetical protein
MALSTSQMRAEYSAYLCNTRGYTTIEFLGRAPVRVIDLFVEGWSAAERALLANGYPQAQNVGSYNCRKISGSSRYSLHAYRLAIDVDAPQNWVQGRGNTMNWSKAKLTKKQVLSVEKIRTNSGQQVFRNGYVFNNPDPMHFQGSVRITDLKTGIDWSTVDGEGSVPLPPGGGTEMFCEHGDGISGRGDVSATRMEVVKSWQVILQALGQDTGGTDGKYWDKTKNAVMAVVPGADGMQIHGVESGAINVALGLLGPGFKAHQHDDYALNLHAHEVEVAGKMSGTAS